MIIAFTLINIIGFVLVALDKHKARKHLWRIPEKYFFFIAVIGGSIGVYISMLLFRHKTRHWYFMLGIPMILALQMLLAYFL